MTQLTRPSLHLQRHFDQTAEHVSWISVTAFSTPDILQGGGLTQQHTLTLGLLVEAIPLHLAPSNITAHKVAPIAKEHSVPHGVNVWRSEVSNASVAGVLAVGWVPLAHQLLSNLYSKEHVVLRI